MSNNSIREVVREEIYKILSEQEQDLPESVESFIETLSDLKADDVNVYNLLQSGSSKNLYEIYVEPGGQLEVPVKDIKGIFEIEKVAKYGSEFYISFWGP